jgi:hypothetical protein
LSELAKLKDITAESDNQTHHTRTHIHLYVIPRRLDIANREMLPSLPTITKEKQAYRCHGVMENVKLAITNILSEPQFISKRDNRKQRIVQYPLQASR